VATLLAFLASAESHSAVAQQRADAHPDCAGVDNWAARMAFTHLKNAGLIENSTVDFKKTHVTRLASQQLGKDLYRQVHDVKFTEKSGNVIEIITMNDASHQECSVSGVDVFVVSKHLGGR
jgi:ethanolamine ammonia-lyase large subunit